MTAHSRKPRPFARLALGLLTASFFACKPNQDTTASTQAAPAADAPFELGKPGGTRLITVPALPNSFNPYLGTEQSSLTVINQTFLGLMRIDAQHGKMEPALAASLTPDPSRKVWTIKLRPNLKWSDGKPLTAADVVFTYTQIINNPAIPNNYRDFWAYQGAFPKVEALDPLTLRFTLTQPFAPFEHNLTAPILPKHIFADKVKATADGQVAFNQMWNLGTKVQEIVTSGPWKLAEHQPGSRLTLIPNTYYYERDAKGQKLPYLDKLIFSEVGDADVAMIRFKRGETDAYILRPEDYDQLEPLQKSENFTIHNLGPTPSQLFVTFNQSTAKRPDGKPLVDPIKSSWFRNPAFREALSHALDKNAIIHSIYQGRATSQFSHLSRYNPYYDASLKDYQFNPQRASELLYDAGFRQSAGGELYDRDRHRVIFELTTNTGSPQRDAICALLARNWGRLGIKIIYRPQPFNQLSRQLHESFDWEAMVLGLGGSPIEPHFSSSRWKQNGRMHLFNMGSGSGWSGKPTHFEPWEAEMEKLYAAAAIESDEAKRKGLYAKAQQLEFQQLPFIYLVSELNLLAVRHSLGNARPSVYGGSGLQQVNWNAQNQFLKQD
jgi:peptide/nickel transport system substrate-binding protein